MFSKELSSAIQIICNSQHLSYGAASARCHLNERSLVSIARGQAVPTLHTFEKLCIGFERLPNDLLGFAAAQEEGVYRVAMRVIHFRLEPFGNGSYTAFPVCPRCGHSMGREYQSFCECCGQKLSWEGFRHATPLARA